MTTRPLVPSGGVFDADQAATLVSSDTAHWWFTNKAGIVSQAIEDYLPRHERGMLVDVGAGAGGVTAALRWDRGQRLAVEGLPVAAAEGQRRHDVPFLVGKADEVPLREGSACVVTLLDVIEHLPDPAPTLREARRLLGAGGILVVTVPAHAWLWSGADEFLGHQRRYNRLTLRDDLVRGGFEVRAVTHVFSWLVAPVLIQRRLSPSTEGQLGLGANGRALAKIASWLTAAERRVTARHSLPLGTSVLAVARPNTTC